MFRLRKEIEERSLESGDTRTETTHRVVNGSTLKYAPSKEVSQKFKLGNTSFLYELGYKPQDLNTDDKTLQLKHKSQYQPASGKLESTETVKFGSP